MALPWVVLLAQGALVEREAEEPADEQPVPLWPDFFMLELELVEDAPVPASLALGALDPGDVDGVGEG